MTPSDDRELLQVSVDFFTAEGVPGVFFQASPESRPRGIPDVADLSRIALDLGRRAVTADVGAEVLQVGSQLLDPAVVREIGARRAFVYLCPRYSMTEEWRQAEALPWEAAAHGQRFLVADGHCVVRAIGTEAPIPVDIAREDVRILVIASAPRGSSLRLDTGRAVGAIAEACQRLCGPEITVFPRPGENASLAGLRDFLRQQRRWHAVHVIAHGDRNAAQRAGTAAGGILLENAQGREDWVPFLEFADVLGTVEPPPLITLNVCDSSPLAVELAHRFSGRTRVIAQLSLAHEGTMERFFGDLYRQVFGQAETTGPIHVEDAFRSAIARLWRDRSRFQWFVPVLYAPRTLAPILDRSHDPERDLLDILRELDGTDDDESTPSHEDVLDRLQSFCNHPRGAIREQANRLTIALRQLLEMERHVTELTDEVTSFQPGVHSWAEIHGRWLARDVELARTASAEGVRFEQPTERHEQLQRFAMRLKDLVADAVTALSLLADYERGRLGELTQGLTGLLPFLQAQGVKPSARAKAAELLRSEIRAQANAILDDLEPGSIANACREGKLSRGVLALAQLGEIVDRAHGRLLDDGTLADCRGDLEATFSELTQRVRDNAIAPTLDACERSLAAASLEVDPIAKLGQLQSALKGFVELGNLVTADHLGALSERFDAVRAKLDQILAECRRQLATVRRPRRQRPPEELLKPGRRLDLCYWLQAKTEDSAISSRAPELPATTDALFAHINELRQALSSAAEQQDQRLVATHVGLLANEAAPFRVARDLAAALHPYMVLYECEVDWDTPSDQIEEKSAAIARTASQQKTERIRAATAALVDDHSRRALDLRMLPTRDRAGVTVRYQQIAAAVLEGSERPESWQRGLDELDCRSITAVLGDLVGAAEEAHRAALQHPEQCDAVHQAYLLALEQLALQEESPETFPAAFRRATALLGILIGHPSYLHEWLKQRLWAYSRPIPTDLGPQVDGLAKILREPLAESLATFERTHPSLRQLGRRLRLEVAAEIDCAKLLGTRGIALRVGGRSVPLVGGFLAAEQRDLLPQVGRWLAETHVSIRNIIDDTERWLNWVSATNLSREVVARLAVLFSELRLAASAGPDDALELLGLHPEGPHGGRPRECLVPDHTEIECHDICEGVYQLLESPDLAVRFPMYAHLPEKVRAPVLATHAARLARMAHLDRAGRLLRKRPVNKARVLESLTDAFLLDRYEIDLANDCGRDRALTDLSRVPGTAIQDVLTPWAVEVLVELDNTTSTANIEQLSQTMEAACSIYAVVTSGLRLRQPPFLEALAMLHDKWSVFLANHLDRHREAYRHSREAFRLLATDPTIARNFVVSSALYGRSLHEGGDRSKAREIVTRGITKGTEALTRVVGDTKSIDVEIEKARRLLASFEQQNLLRPVRSN